MLQCLTDGCTSLLFVGNMVSADTNGTYEIIQGNSVKLGFGHFLVSKPAMNPITILSCQVKWSLFMYN